jgi:sulfatase maturation enzyme AslB (radical SAM superfamily)
VSFCPCDNFNDTPELRIGNVMENALAEIYASGRVRQLWDWQSFGTPEFCKGCSFHIPLSLLNDHPTILADPHQIVGAG